MIATHTVRSVDTVDCDAAAACLTLLASICGSMAMGDKNVAWQSYESARKLEKELNDMPMHVLLTYLGAAFSRLPSLTELQCTANTGSRYCHRLLEYHPTELSSILQATGSYPCFRGHFQAHLRTPASEYSAAAIISYLLFCPEAESLTLDGITASTLNTMLFAIPTLPLALPIEELVLDPFLHPILEENNAKMLEVFESLLRRMPLLEKLRYVPYVEARHCAEPDLDLYFDYYNTFCDDKPLPCLPDPDAISGRLSCLELGSLYCSSVQLTKMLRSLSKSLKRLDLGLMFLHGGYWVDVFHFIRQHLENLEHIELVDWLCEVHNSSKGFWCGDMLHHTNECDGRCFRSRLYAWLERKCDECPVTGTSDGGSPAMWARMENPCFEYELEPDV